MRMPHISLFFAELAQWPGDESVNHPARDRSLAGAMGVGVV